MKVGSELSQDRLIARQLQRAWPAFFESFGRLTSIQRAVIPNILEGDDVLVCSATASGKTEAACAPLIERNIDRRQQWTILYISPTRALVNDLYERLYTPLYRLGLRLGRRTGDHREQLTVPPHVLLTTPESFDSMLCRGRYDGEQGHFLASTVAVVLDEIHLLHGTARGEQVRWLLERLNRLRKFAMEKGWTKDPDVQVVGLSATVPEPESVSKAYLKQGKIIRVPGSREIETVYPTEELHTVEKILPLYLESRNEPEKMLVFSKSRRRVDELAAIMKPILRGLGYRVVAHHGSLSKKVREEAEDAAKTEQRIVIFATSTLEIGVDIGNIDLVVLDGPANDIPALLQRIGRGNRRTNKTRVLTCAKTKTETLIQTAMINAAREGWLGKGKGGPQHAVARQQVASYIFQGSKRSRSRSKIQELVDSCAAPIVAKGILDAMLNIEELVHDGNGLRLGEDWLELCVRGGIHSNIEDTPGANVIDERTGDLIAEGVSFRGGRGLRTGGQLLRVRKYDSRQIEVRTVTDEREALGEWGYASRSGLMGDGQAHAVRRYLGIDENVWPVISGEDSFRVYHFGGDKLSTIIKLIAKEASKEKDLLSANQFFIELKMEGNHYEKPAWLINVSAAVLELAIIDKIDSMERRLGRPWVNQKLPIEARIDEVKGWLKLEEEIEKIQAAQFIRDIESENRKIITRYF